MDKNIVAETLDIIIEEANGDLQDEIVRTAISEIKGYGFDIEYQDGKVLII